MPAPSFPRHACALLAAAGLGSLVLPSLAQVSPPAVSDLPVSGTRGPSDIVFSADGKLAYVTEQDEGQVALVDAATGKTLGRIPSGGTGPTALALSPDGRTLVATNGLSGTLGLLDVERRTLRATLPLRGEPRDVVITRTGEAWVSLAQLNQIAVVDLAAGKVTTRIEVGHKVVNPEAPVPAAVGAGHRPRALALTTDGTRVLCGTLNGGALSVLDASRREEIACLRLPAVNVRGLAVSRDGETAYVTAQKPGNDAPTERPEAMWSNVLFQVRLSGPTPTLERTIPLDHGDLSAADPAGVTLHPAANTLLVSLAGAHSVASIPATGEAAAVSRWPAGLNPVTLEVRPGTEEAWVVNHLSNSLMVLDRSGKALRTVELDAPSRSDIRLRGRLLFASAHVTRGQRFTCNSCHPDGNTDGLSWQFAHLKDGVERRNTRNIRGVVLLTPPYRWSGKEVDFEDFVQDEVIGLLRSPKMSHADLHAYWDLVNELPMPPNPHRQPNGAFSAPALRGKALFAGKAGCGSCHAGPQAGGTGKKEWVGTMPAGVKLDVPHLAGAYDTAPYLHDGRAATLEEIFSKHNAAGKHGKAAMLTPAELADVLRYVREL